MKRYEGLFILNTTAREEGIKETIDKITAEINRLGGRVETVQKMDKRNFSRVTRRTRTSGFYANVIFELRPESIQALRKAFALSEDILRVLFTVAPQPQPAAA